MALVCSVRAVDEDPWPFGDQRSPWTDAGHQEMVRQSALGCRRVLRSGYWLPMILMVLAVLALPLIVLAIDALF